MSEHPHAAELLLEPADNVRLANLCGPVDEHLRMLERRLGVELNNRGNHFRILGEPDAVNAAGKVLESLYRAAGEEQLTRSRIHLHLQQSGVEALLADDAAEARDEARERLECPE